MKNYSSLVLRRVLLLMMIFLVAESLRVSPQYQWEKHGTWRSSTVPRKEERKRW
ncbi:hypothetical protein SLEP1_g12573 [Rubroshorea leprosula]|uniref:Uncharacterized protein n=1 Tax=Rubroshorea leprosula TaxID=152421 RepID=A0AAV5IIP8_9ROSI|nr:hypothetical protein SLEP1_g12573 [Rubroshorea leprosula]